jgi:hypothetical protein
LNTAILPSKVLILVGAACLFWIMLFSVSFAKLSGLAPSNGWLMAGALAFASAAWILLMVREVRNAVELPDPYGSAELTDHERFQSEAPEVSPIFPADAPPAERWTPVQNPVRRRPRKARSERAEALPRDASSEIFHPDV